MTIEIPQMDRATQNRFWASVDRRGSEKCWPWKGAVTDKGVGKFSIQKRYYKAHRIACALDERDPTDHLVIRTCGHPTCCNPEHLVVGDDADNGRIAAENGRMEKHSAGESNPRAKLNAAQVAEIKTMISSGHTNMAIAEVFPVTHSMVSLIRCGRAWRDS